MTKTECFREPDVIDAVMAGEWPDRVEPALRDHVDSCPICAEVLAVALALQVSADETRAVHVPTAAHVWWRAGIRARQDAAQKAAAPVTIVEGVAAASGVGLAAAGIVMGWPAVSSGVREVVSLPSLPSLAIAGAALAAAAVVLVPVALYFALSEPKS